MSSNKSVPFVIPLVAEITCLVGPSETAAVRTDGVAGKMGPGKLDDSAKNPWFPAENNLETETETIKLHSVLN